MKLNITNVSVTRLFTLVRDIAEVKALIQKQETAIVGIRRELAELLSQQEDLNLEVATRAEMLREGNMDGLKELLQLQWFQQDIAKKVSHVELRIAGAESVLSILEDELRTYQREVDATLEGRCEVDAQRDISES